MMVGCRGTGKLGAHFSSCRRTLGAHGWDGRAEGPCARPRDPVDYEEPLEVTGWESREGSEVGLGQSQ